MRPSVSTPSTSQERKRTRRARASSSASHQIDSRAKQVVQVHAPDQRAGVVHDDELRDLRRRLHQHRRNRRRGDPLRSCAACASSIPRRRVASRSPPLTQAAAQIAVGEDARDAPVVVGDDRHAHALAAHLDDRFGERRAYAARAARASPVRMTSATRVSNRRPSVPPGCERAKSSTENPRASSSASASASPSASAAVVLAVGARPSGHASASTAASRCTSADCASELCSLPVSAIELRALALEVRRQQHELVGFAGIRQHDDDVVRRDHAEVAVRRLRPDARRTPACRSMRAWRRACARRAPTCRCRTRRRGPCIEASARLRRRTVRRAALQAPRSRAPRCRARCGRAPARAARRRRSGLGIARIAAQARLSGHRAKYTAALPRSPVATRWIAARPRAPGVLTLGATRRDAIRCRIRCC